MAIFPKISFQWILQKRTPDSVANWATPIVGWCEDSQLLVPAAVDSSGRTIIVPVGLASVNITTSTTTVVKASAGVLHNFVINLKGASAGTAILYDNASAASGTVLATIATGLNAMSLTYNIAFTNGLVIVTSGSPASDLTVTYR